MKPFATAHDADPSPDDRISSADGAAHAPQVRPLTGHRYEVQLPHEATTSIVHRLPATDDSRSDHPHLDHAHSDHPTAARCSCWEEHLGSCPHTAAVEAWLQARRQRAAVRRQWGLTYTGSRILVASRLVCEDDDAPTSAIVDVWEGERARPLDPAPSQQLFNHSPTGFEWGYGGSGPSQLALAILLDFTGETEVALAYYHDFKMVFLVGLPREPTPAWEIHGHEIEGFLRVQDWQAPAVAATPEVASEQEWRDASPWRDASLRADTSPLAETGRELEFPGYYGAPSRCRAYLHRQRGHSIVLLCDLPQSFGTSVTNRIEVVAALACVHFRIETSRLVLIQYHPPTSISGESLLRVSFRQTAGELRYPQWTALTRHQAADLWGRGLPF